MSQAEKERVEYIPWVQIVPDPAQPREEIPPDHVDRVADSIKHRGLLQYPRVRFDAALGKYVIIIGHCRWLACQKEKANLDPVPCIVVSGDPPEEMVLLDQITENELRQGFKPMDLARALSRLKSLKKWTGKQLAAETGLSSPGITRSESLLTLPEEVQALVDTGEVPVSHAYDISRLPDQAAQVRLAMAVAGKKWSREKLADAIRDEVGDRNGPPKEKPKDGRLSKKLDGGVSVTVSAARTLTQADIKAAIAWLRGEEKKLPAESVDANAPMAQAS